jgi:hypothetical protein
MLIVTTIGYAEAFGCVRRTIDQPVFMLLFLIGQKIAERIDVVAKSLG